MRFRSSFVLYSFVIALTVCGLLAGWPKSGHTGGRGNPGGDLWNDKSVRQSLKQNQSLRAVRVVAKIEFVRDTLGVISDVHPGDTIDGLYLFDSRTRDSTNNPTSGNFQFSSAQSGIFLRMGNHHVGTDPENADFSIHIENLEAGNQFTLVSRNNLCQPSLRNDSGMVTIDHVWWCLHDFKGTAVADDGLPSGALELNHWQSLVGLRIEGTVTDSKSDSQSSLLVIAKVIQTENITP